MAKTLKLRRATTAALASITGAEGEVIMDTTEDTLTVHDGVLAGGYPLARASSVVSTFSGLTDATSAALTVDELYLQAATRLDVTNNGTVAYRFDQYGTTDDPTIYVTAGTSIAFNLANAGHPFLIRTSGGVNYDTGLVHASTTGTVLTGSAAQGQVSDTLYWKIPSSLSGNYQYICGNHSVMVGVIVVNPAASLVNVTNESKATIFTSPTFTGTVAAFSSATHTLTGSSNLVFTGSSSGSVTFAAGATPAIQTYTLPVAYPSVNGYALTSTTGGALSWAAVSGGGGGGTTNNALTFITGLSLNSATTFDGSAAKTVSLATSGASAGSYGSVSGSAIACIPSITVDTYGRVTNISQTYWQPSSGGGGGNSFSNIYANAGGTLSSPMSGSPSTLLSASNSSDSLYLLAGTNITITASSSPSKAIMISSTGGAASSSSTWTYGQYNTGIMTLTAPAGVTTSGQQLWVAILGEGLGSSNINSVTCNGYSMSFRTSGGPDGGNSQGMVLYSINTGSSLNTNVSISMNSFVGYPMATCWVTTSNSMNMTTAMNTTTSSSSAMISYNPSYQKGPGRVIFMFTSPSLNMTTAISSPPSGWTSEGTAQHSSNSSLTAAVFKAPDPWSSSSSFTVTSSSFITYAYGMAQNS